MLAYLISLINSNSNNGPVWLFAIADVFIIYCIISWIVALNKKK